MARETKADRMAREEREYLEYLEQQLRAWPERMMRTMERATNHSMCIEVVDGKFVVSTYSDKNSWESYVEFRFSPIPKSDEDWNSMENLELELNYIDRRESDRLLQDSLRSTALSKLSKEEKLALGL